MQSLGARRGKRYTEIGLLPFVMQGPAEFRGNVATMSTPTFFEDHFLDVVPAIRFWTPSSEKYLSACKSLPQCRARQIMLERSGGRHFITKETRVGKCVQGQFEKILPGLTAIYSGRGGLGFWRGFSSTQVPLDFAQLNLVTGSRRFNVNPERRALHEFPDCLLIVYRCTRTHSPHSPPWPYTTSRVSLTL